MKDEINKHFLELNECFLAVWARHKKIDITVRFEFRKNRENSPI